MEKLKVGDEVFMFKYNRYTFTKVARVTNTLAILENGTRLKNTPLQNHWGEKEIYFDEYASGYYTDKYEITTEAIKEKAKKHAEDQKKCLWFFKQKFSDEQKVLIYDLLYKDENI